jgi:hypothetical protein
VSSKLGIGSDNRAPVSYVSQRILRVVSCRFVRENPHYFFLLLLHPPVF